MLKPKLAALPSASCFPFSKARLERLERNRKEREIARFRLESRMKAVLDIRVPTETTKHIRLKYFSMLRGVHDSYTTGWVHYWLCARQCLDIQCTIYIYIYVWLFAKVFEREIFRNIFEIRLTEIERRRDRIAVKFEKNSWNLVFTRRSREDRRELFYAINETIFNTNCTFQVHYLCCMLIFFH